MPLPYSEEQLNAMSNEELLAIKKQLQTKAKPPGFSVRGAVLGGLKSLVGESPDLTPKEDVATKINEMIATEKAKRELLPKTPQETLAQMELDERERRKTEGNQPIESVSSVETTTPFVPLATPKTTSTIEAPPMFISKPKGKDKYGAMEYETVDNPEYEAWTKAREKERETTVKSQRAMPATREFIRRFTESRQELINKGFKNVGEATIKGFGERTGAFLTEKTGQLPNTTRFINRLSVIANASAREIEGGRITDQDRAVYASAMANALKFPDETNIGLVADNLIDLKNKGANIEGLLDEFENSGQDIFVNIAQEARRIEGTGIDDFSKMSDEELKAIIRGEK